MSSLTQEYICGSKGKGGKRKDRDRKREKYRERERDPKTSDFNDGIANPIHQGEGDMNGTL